MNRKWVLLVAVMMVLTASMWGWAGEGGKQANTTFTSELSKGPVGRFQAVTMEDSSVLILDTKEGHVWVWDLSGLGTVSMVYGGQVFLGERVGEMMQSVLPAAREK